MEGSLVAYKVFTNGSVLQASEINENLMRQSVAVFTNAAARTAAITSPVEGQMTYLEDTNQYASWTGSSWVSPFGLTLIKQETIGTSVATLSLTNVFSSQFDNYLITANGGTAASTGLIGIQIPGVTGYKMTFLYTNFNNSPSAIGGTGFTTIEYGGTIDSSNGISMELSVGSPNLEKATTFFANNAGNSSGYLGFTSARLSNTSQYTAINLIFSSAVTGGTVCVYGYRKAA
jgi:hypothetical protein